MAEIVFYEKPGCVGNAQQKTLLRAAGHSLVVRDILSWPWDATMLLAFLAPLPVSDWFNRQAPAVKSGAIQPDQLDPDIALPLLLATPLLIRRPLMVCGDSRMVGFDTAQVNAWLGTTLAVPLAATSLEACRATT